MGLLDLGTRDDEQSYGAEVRDRSVSRAFEHEEAISRRLHQRLEIHCRGDALVGGGMDLARMAAQGWRNRKSGAVEARRFGGRILRNPVELGARSQWPAAERVRESPRY